MAEREDWNPHSKLHPSIHPSIPITLGLGWVMGRPETFLSQRQENTLDRWPVHHRDNNHTNIHIHTHLQSVIDMSCISLDCGRSPEETNVNMERTNTQKGLLVQLVLQYLFYLFVCIYCFRNVRVVSALYYYYFPFLIFPRFILYMLMGFCFL